jgi:S-formylglutathione hydrolase
MTAPAGLTLLNRYRCFGGWQQFFSHAATSTRSDMRFGLYLPPQAESGAVPLLIYLAGLTCNEETFAIKAGAQRVAAELGLALLTPDTSPRVRLPGDDASYDFGLAAGFYLDAIEAPWSAHYRMYSYVSAELPGLVARAFPLDAARIGLMGHSMGGHGALTIGLKHPATFRTLSALSPISAPMHCPWGEKALTGYLGPDRQRWRACDATALLAQLPAAHPRHPLLVDQGLDDEFLERQLLPERLEAACQAAAYPLTLRRHAGYGHGYWFVQSVIEDHLRHHARGLGL